MSATDDLKAFRNQLVEDRRKAIIEGLKPGADVAQWAMSVKTLQERIAAIDGAIDDERSQGGVAVGRL
jgi:hypothetical protein